MAHQLQNKRFVEFDKLIQEIDPQIVKEFVSSVIKKIVIKDGHVASICFKNGLEHKFLYKNFQIKTPQILDFNGFSALIFS